MTIQPPDTLTFKRSHFYAVLVPLAFVTGLAVGYIFWGRVGMPAAAGAVVATEPARVVRYDVPTDDDPFLGPANAQITIIEFSDYECPYCTKWHNEVWSKILEAYPDEVRLVYRDFPLFSLHGNAAQAAEAANCAGEQNAYWQFHEKLFDAQYGLGSDAFKKYASDLKLDIEAFDECLTSRRFKDEVQADYEYAANLGVRSTPTFFINGIPLVGAQPFEVFDDIIQQELAGEIPK